MAPCIGSADGTVMRSATPPGPPISPMQQAQRFAEGGVGLIRECHALLGDTFTLQLGSSMPPFVVLCNPEDVLQVFQNKEGAFSGGEGNRAALVHIPMGESFLMALEGKAHRAMQVMLGGIFKNAESDLAEGIRWRTELLVDSWQHPDVLYIREDIQRLALGVIFGLLFNEPLTRLERRAVEATKRMLDTTVLGNEPNMGGAALTFWRKRDEVFKVFEEAIEPRRRGQFRERRGRAMGPSTSGKQQGMSWRLPAQLQQAQGTRRNWVVADEIPPSNRIGRLLVDSSHGASDNQ